MKRKKGVNAASVFFLTLSIMELESNTWIVGRTKYVLA